MLYTKKTETITYQDVLDFCNERYRESIHLDYKQNIDGSLAKTIAAMANTWGGLIVIGVEDEDSKPKLPISGIPFEEHLRERINNIVLGNITPPVFPEVQVCQSVDEEKALIVIRVPQSSITPHAIRGNTKVYIRTDTSNEPEELATLDRVSWLTEKREKSVELKNSFFARSEERFRVLCKRNDANIVHTDAIYSMCPIYPFEVLTDYVKLREEIPRKIKVQAWGISFPSFLETNYQYSPSLEGTYGFFINKDYGYVLYEELNHYGYFYHREDMGHSEQVGEGEIKHRTLMWEVLRTTDSFFEAMNRFYTELGYWGSLDLKLSLNKLEDVSFYALPAPRGYSRWENIAISPIDHKLVFSKTIPYRDLSEKRIELVIDLIKEVGWAIGFPDTKAEEIHKLMVENRRA